MTFPPPAPLAPLAPLASVSVDELVQRVVETRRVMSVLQAQEMALLAAAVGTVLDQAGEGGADLPMRSLSAELGAALRVGDRTVQRQLSDASRLVEEFPATYAALAAGEISRAHVSVIMDAGWHLTDPDARAVYEASVLSYAREETPARLRPVARLRAERVVPSSLQERHDRARASRGVRVCDVEDGMSVLTATLPSVLAHGAYDRLTALAHHIRTNATGTAESEGGVEDAGRAGSDAGAGTSPDAESVADRRSMDELRADVLADLVLAADPAGHETPTGLAAIRAQVQVVVPVLTLMPGQGAGREAGELAGHGPVDADTARRLAGHAPGWDRVLTHPVTGAVLTVDRYRPSEDIKRALRVRDRHCRFVGCRQPVHRCDLDHTLDAALGGATSNCNLAHLCRRHHILKQHTAWTVRQLPDGILEWTSPTGRTYTDTPTSTTTFTPTNPPPDGPPGRGRTSAPEQGASGAVHGRPRAGDADPPPF